MTDSNESNETVTCDVFVSETERKRALSHEVSHEVSASADLPPSLVSYFEASRSRAAECEKLITEDVEDLMNLATELNENTLKPNQQDRGNEEASCVLPETEAPARVTASPRDEDETETDDYGEKRKHSTSRLSEFSLTKEEIKENNEHQQAHKEKRRFEELKKEDEIRQRENDFQMELKKLMEAEKLHQIELQLMEKRAQEKLDQELLLQQELINNIQKQVGEQRRMIAEELKRMKEEEEKKRKEEEEKIRIEIRRKKMEEENKQILEKRAEEERRLKEEQRKREEEEERREREEVRIKMEEEKRKREEEDRKRREKEIMKREMQRRRIEEEMRRKKEEDRKITEELRTEEEEEEEKTKREEEKSKVEEEMTKNKVETKTDKCNEKIWLEEEKTSQMEQMEGETNAKKMENKSNLKVQKEEQKAGKREEGKTNEDDIRKEKKPEEARRETMTTDEQKGKREEEKQKTVDGTQLSEDRNKIRKNNVIRTEEEKLIQEEWRKRQEEENDEEIRSSEEKEHEAKIRKVEDNRTRTERESEQEQMKEEVIETTENLKAEGRWHEKEEESKIMQEEMETRSNDLQEKTHRSSGPETLTSVTSLTSQLEDGPRSSGLEAPVTERQDAAVQRCSSGPSSPLSPREQKRLSWTSGCTSWCKLSLQNRRKQNGPPRGGRRRPRTGGVPAPGPDALLQAAGGGSVQQVTSVTLEDRPGCSAASLALCSHLQSLTLRRCGLTSLEGVSHLSQLCYIDVTENHISFVDCEGMTSLRVLRLAHNKLTSIHGLRGANNLDELELSHNNITRIAGLESMKRLQRLSVDHNQLISTKGLRDVYTLLHLNCSHNHLADVEGLENNALLRTLDLSSNSLPEPPALDNHVLLTELHLDDNSISSLQALAAACWLPLMHTLSVAQNRITQLPSMSDFVSLANLDLQFNCMSELHNVCESLEGCVSLQRVHLRGNPLQQENGWRSTLQRALPGLRAVDDQQTDGLLSPPAVQQISSASDTFLKFCQTQLQQMNDLLQQHSRELSEASSPLDAVKSLCQHFTETLKLAEDQRFAHECGDVTASEGRTHVQSSTATKLIEDAQTESSETAPAVGSSGIHENGPGTSEAVWLQSSDAGTKETGLHSLSEKRTTSSSSAARVIQRQWRTCRQNHGDMSRHPLAASGHGAHPEPGPPCGPHSVLDQHSAAAAIQASWRGFAVRRRLASALAAVTFPSTTEDHAFEEDDVDEFVFDEAAELENLWTLQLSDEWLSRREPVSEQPPSVKFPGPLPEPQNTHTTPPVWRPKQAWAPEEVAPGGRASPESCHRKSPASSSVLSGISERSEKILEEWGFADSHTALQMLKRAHNMKWKQQLKRKHKDPPVGSALFYQLVPVEGGNRAAPRSSRHRRGALCGTETVKQESAEQRLHGQCDRSSESARFLPALSSDVLNGGRVQLVADPGFSERRRASGQRATSASCALQHSSAPRTSLGRAKSDASSPNGGAAAPRVKERISFRDGAVQLSGGWGGGRKRSSLH
ncbi:leucine-rich repeat and IQ domain-containing protein 1 isoform X2 [Betta splendens]|uniref:Leucine-rich repeat and IQ domain-containing protein 1 isoform X2 n=1 Tax=Betta splendens TaxID=158456 RepID=A0A6P7MSF5_BETSP|nr:leucine-rich repeat and IQ domain-containing protein 1 isoform X2 [Betta splendens]